MYEKKPEFFGSNSRDDNFKETCQALEKNVIDLGRRKTYRGGRGG